MRGRAETRLVARVVSWSHIWILNFDGVRVDNRLIFQACDYMRRGWHVISEVTTMTAGEVLEQINNGKLGPYLENQLSVPGGYSNLP